MNHRQDILYRRRGADGRTLRVLECGHEQPEPACGHAKNVVSMICTSCGGLAKSHGGEVVGTCTAFVFPTTGKARACGLPARFMKRGEPRCSKHNLGGSK